MREPRDDRQRALYRPAWRASGAAKLGPICHIRIPRPWWTRLVDAVCETADRISAFFNRQRTL